MTISKHIGIQKAFVWVWLPEQANPIVAGKIKYEANIYLFKYAKSYLRNLHAIPLSPFELPLEDHYFRPEGINNINSCLRDAAPDAWGRRVINNQYHILEASEIDYMLLSGSNRIGALDFQESPTHYVNRDNDHPELKDLMHASEYIEKNLPLPRVLQNVLLHGTSIGGARPKALVNNSEDKMEYIAKFSSITDSYNIIKAEYIAMRLAKLAGINVANVALKSVLKKDVLLIERFDRKSCNNIKTRKMMLSGLSILGLNELEARYASYIDFADAIRKNFYDPKQDLHELYKRLIFNILIGNNDDHARNHAAFWDGKYLYLTPAYDLCPQPRIGLEATQAMAINGKYGNQSRLSNALSVCEHFQLDSNQAKQIIDSLTLTIQEKWELVCAEAKITKLEQAQLWQKSILNPFCFQ